MLKFCFALIFMLICGFNSAFANEKILYVPLDTRPITCSEVILAGEKTGATVIAPPYDILGTEKAPGDPERIWDWLEENAPNADAAVVSTDALVYGSLVESRKHTLTEAQAKERAERFKTLRDKYPNLKLYAYSTILRTLLSMNHSAAGMEPAIYQENAVKIYRYSALLDKREMGIASSREVREFNRLKADINPNVMEDWSNRHAVNWGVNEKLVDLTKDGVFSFFLLGGDDSAIYSATHREARMLKVYAKEKNVDRTKIQVTAGADELGMMMLSRAILDMRSEIPFVYVIYNDGKGKDTLPKYCFDTVENDIKAEVLAIGAMEVPTPNRADFTFMVNTAINGKTLDANNGAVNKKKSNSSTRAFMKKLNKAINEGQKVFIGDIAYSNGADNALMEAVRKDNLQFKIHGYGGWNTATNSLGFLMGEAALANYMTEKSRNELMLHRYLDDWAYQSNVRQDLIRAYASLPGEADPTGATLGTKLAAAEKYTTDKVKDFARENIKLPSGFSLENLNITLPWKRFFECKVKF